MKRNEYIVEGFRRDNPGGDWLQHKRQKTIDKGRVDNMHVDNLPDTDRPYTNMGAITGWCDQKVLVPMDKLRAVKGARGEQHAKRDHSLKWLRNNMKIKNGQIMLTKYERAPEEVVKKRQAGGYIGNPYWTRVEGEYEPNPPFINVDQDGVPWIIEGNHRIIVADEMGARAAEVEIRWHNGGEDVDGEFSPGALGLTGSN